MFRPIEDLVTLAKLTFTLRRYDPGFLYDQVDLKNFLGTNKLFLNLGYWNYHDDYDQACTNLALKLSDWAELAAQQDVLAAGCGLGEECHLWQQHYQLNSVTGINLSKKQLATANSKFSNEKISFLKANTTKMGFSDQRFDRVLALESGMHFHPKIKFFKEAYRVLKPGGILGTADIIRNEQPVSVYWKSIIKFYAKMAQCPKENFCQWETYQDLLSQAGFTDIEMIDVSKRVFAGLSVFVRDRISHKQLYVSPVLKLLAAINAKEGFPFRYVIVRAKRA